MQIVENAPCAKATNNPASPHSNDVSMRTWLSAEAVLWCPNKKIKLNEISIKYLIAISCSYAPALLYDIKYVL